LTNNGISRIRMTTTRPTMEKVQVQPLSGFIPIADSSWWNMTRIQLTPSFSQSRMNMLAVPS